MANIPKDTCIHTIISQIAAHQGLIFMQKNVQGGQGAFLAGKALHIGVIR